MRNKSLVLIAFLILALLVAACTTAPATAPTTAPAGATEEPAEQPAAVETTASAAQPAATDGALPDLGGRTVVAVTGNDYVPLNFIDPRTGKAVGWEYDAVNEACRRLNCTVDWQVTAWDTMISAIREGQFDIGMDGITITDERKGQVDFSDPYMVSQQFMLVRADEDRFANASGVRRRS